MYGKKRCGAQHICSYVIGTDVHRAVATSDPPCVAETANATTTLVVTTPSNVPNKAAAEPLVTLTATTPLI